MSRLWHWLGRQSLSRMLLVAAAWPLLLIGYALLQLLPIVWEIRGGTGALYGVQVSSWTGVTAVLLGPSLLVFAVWRLARWYRPPAA